MSPSQSPSEWRSHGTLLLPCLAGISLVSVHGYSLGVMMSPLEQEFGWSRAEISSGNMVIALVSFFLSPLVGVMIDRVGPRPIAVTGVIAYCAILASFSTISDDIVSWVMRWGILGLASTMILPTVWMTAINGVFDRNRGKALAIALLGTGLSAAFVPSLANMLMGEFGWRGAYIAMAAIMGVIVLTLVLLFFFGATDRRVGKAGATATLPGLTLRAGLRSRAFIRLTTAVFVFGVTSLALTINAVPILETRGFGRTVAAGIAGLLGIGSIIGRLGGGLLLDRIDAKKVAAASVFAPILSISLLLLAPGTSAVAAIAMLLLGLALGAEVDACSYLAARHFGMRSFGSLFGTIIGFTVFGTGMAPVLANYIYDLTGSYDPFLWGTLPLCLFSSLLFLSLGRYPSSRRPCRKARRRFHRSAANCGLRDSGTGNAIFK